MIIASASRFIIPSKVPQLTFSSLYHRLPKYQNRPISHLLTSYNTPSQKKKNQQRKASWLSKEAATAPPNFDSKNRWRAIPAANLVHLSIGSVYVYSMWTPGLTTAVGVVSSASADWTPSDVLPVFSMAAVTLGLTTSMLGSWVERVGPRKSGTLGSLAWGSALIVTGLGVEMHSLPLVYSGYGFLGGIGWGLMYLTPVSVCMRWFPDRRGMATGIALSAFGAGAAIAPVVIQQLIDLFFVAPEFIGEVASGVTPTVSPAVSLTTLADGSQIISDQSSVGVSGTPVVVAAPADAAKVSLSPGVYALNTGDTGVSRALVACGVLYGSLGAVASRFLMLPHPDWMPEGFYPSSDTSSMSVGLPVDVAMRTPQFPLLWLAVFGNATGGLALLSSSKLMITDIWAGLMPEIVTASFTTGYVSALGGANAMGRFGWAYASDYFGRQNTYRIFALGIPIIGGAPYLCHLAIHELGDTTTVLPLACFYTGSVLAISFYGGIFSVLPAYIADLFGQKHAGAIHGKLLTAWAASAVAGPIGLVHLRSTAYESAVQDLLKTIDQDTFQQTFGCVKENAQPLIDAKTITIARLMDIAPSGTVDPTPFLYDTTCYIAATLVGISALANIAIKPIDVNKVLAEKKDMDSKQ